MCGQDPFVGGQDPYRGDTITAINNIESSFIIYFVIFISYYYEKNYNIVDTNLRNRQSEPTIDEKIQAIKSFWNLEVKNPEYISGSTGTIRFQSKTSVSSKKDNFFLKNIADSYNSAQFISSLLSYLRDNTKLPVPDIIKTSSGHYSVKIGNFYL